MRPDPSKVLMGVAMALLTKVTPDVRSPFGQQNAGMAGALAAALAQEVDRLADRLHTESQVVSALLRDARPCVDSSLQANIDAAVAIRPADIRVSTLQAQNDALRLVLCDVHAAVEEQETPAARVMDERIWAELIESTNRRHIEIMR